MAVDKVGLIYSLNDQLLEQMCVSAGQRHAGVAAAARSLKSQSRITATMANTLVKFDFTYNFIRHLTSQHASDFLADVVTALEPQQYHHTVLHVDGSMMAAKEDDAVSVDTVYPTDINEIYDASWTELGDHCGPDPYQSPRASSGHCDGSQANAVLTPISDGQQSRKPRRYKRGRHSSAPPMAHRQSSSKHGPKWVPKSSSPHHDPEDDTVAKQLFEADDGSTWCCPCGFKNAATNQRCGGAGPLGCNRSRFLDGTVEGRRHRSRSPHSLRSLAAPHAAMTVLAKT